MPKRMLMHAGNSAIIMILLWLKSLATGSKVSKLRSLCQTNAHLLNIYITINVAKKRFRYLRQKT